VSAPAAASGPRAPDPGPYAGAVSRLAAYVVDNLAVSVLFSVGAAATAFLVEIVTGRELDLSGSMPAGTALAVWWVVYFSASWATTGATLGMALLGVRVVRADGAPAGARRAVLRTLAFPLSVALAGLGFLGILFHRQRRALHDLIAGTAVVYDERLRVPALEPEPRLAVDD
jgi:uncharacterized RDD family membrane protein YckC